MSPKFKRMTLLLFSGPHVPPARRVHADLVPLRLVGAPQPLADEAVQHEQQLLQVGVVAQLLRVRAGRKGKAVLGTDRVERVLTVAQHPPGKGRFFL